MNRHCAWIVTDKEDFKGAVVFAIDEAHARGKGARVLCEDDDISYIEARRFPDGDQIYDAGPIPASFLAYSGFTFECSSCGRTISEDECHERALYLDDVQGTQDSSVAFRGTGACPVGSLRRNRLHGLPAHLSGNRGGWRAGQADQG